MSRDIQYIGMDVHKEAIVIAVLNGSGKLVMESIVETKASSILQFIHGLRGGVACDLGRRDLGGLALRSAEATRTPSPGVRSAAQCLIKGRQQERQGGCAQAGRLVAHGHGSSPCLANERPLWADGHIDDVGASASTIDMRGRPP
jgi:hypothetical protein